MRTTNRQAIQVPLPSGNDVKNYFFNHNEWNGVKEDKNFVLADTASFQDCKNVYMNSEKLLRSRPSIKRDASAISGTIANFWAFDDVIAYLVNGTEVSDLVFVNSQGVILYDGASSTLHYSLNEKLNLVKEQDKIFVFSQNSFRYFKAGTPNIFADATSFIYVPETKIFSGTTEKTGEPKNVLTTKEIYAYLYTSELGMPLSAANKQLLVTINDIEYSVQWTNAIQYVVIDKVFDVQATTLYPNDIELVVCGVSGTDIFALYNHDTGQILISYDGVSFSLKTTVPISIINKYRYMKFTADGNHLYIMTSWTVYIISVLATESVAGQLAYKYPVLTDMYFQSDYEFHQHLHKELDNRFVVNICTTNTYVFIKYEILNTNVVNVVINGTLYSPDVFGAWGPIYDTVLYNVPFVYNSLSYDVFIAYIAAGRIVTMAYDTTGTNMFVEIASDVETSTTKILTTRFLDNTFYFTTVTTTCNLYIITMRTDFTLRSRIMCSARAPSADSPLRFRLPISMDAATVLTPEGIYIISSAILVSPIVTSSTYTYPIAYENYYYEYFLHTLAIYSNHISTPITFKHTIDGTYTYKNFSHITELENYYLSENGTLYISNNKLNDDKNYEWYLPERNIEKFSYPITNLHPISKSEVAIFFSKEVWYCSYAEELLSDGTRAYYYIKSKLQVGLREGADVATSYDGNSVMFSCERGLVAMSYQNFVATTEQAITYLSDNIYTLFKVFNTQPIKLHVIGFWIICYRSDSMNAYVLDIRNGSWWPMQYPLGNIQKLLTITVDTEGAITDELRILSNYSLYKLDTGDKNYFDMPNNTNIDWYVTSQKLVLGDVNRYKHIINATFVSVQDGNVPLSFELSAINYRTQIDDTLMQVIAYKVDSVRTFVQRFNFFKVNEFQYKLSADKDAKIRLPLSLCNLSVKYQLTGQVR